MAEVILMPRLSDTMTEGVIAAWHKNIGETVKKGDVLADIETDKATMELESYKDGVLLYQGAKAGEKIQVNDLMAIIGNAGEDVNDLIAKHSNKTSTSAAPQTTAATTENNQPASTTAQVESNAPTQEVSEPAHGGRIFASPLAKKLAEDKGIDLRQLKGSGDGGRIVKNDIDNYINVSGGQPAYQQPKYTPSVSSTGGFEDVPISQMRKTIARRLSESMFTAPHFYLTISVDMDICVNARTRINESNAVKISYNDIVIKAVSMALKQHPAVNSSWLGDKIRFNHDINVGVAVAVEDGLLVPVVRNADQKSLSTIATEVKAFAQKAKDKKLQPTDWEGNTFTISNLGMFGIEQFTAIINPPDACILAVGGISQEPVVKNGQIVPGNVMKMTLSCDHRVVDGATGAAFLQTLKSFLEEPLKMLV